MTAERDERSSRVLPGEVEASMEPRFGDRGTPTHGVAVHRAVPASMEPRFGDRGTERSKPVTGGVSRGFNGAAVR